MVKQYADFISEQQRRLGLMGLAEAKDELIKGGSHQGASIHLNRTKTDNGDGETSHYEIHHKDGSKHTFTVNTSKHAPDENPEKERAAIGKRAKLPADHPFVKAIHASHTGSHGGPEAWQE